MERDTVIIGVVFIVVGAILFFMGQSMTSSFEYRYNSMFGQQSNLPPFMILIGIVLLIVGFIITIVGVSRGEKKIIATNNVFCQVCGIPKGNRHFYVVNNKDKKLLVCEQCVELYRKEIVMKNKGVEQTSHDESLNILKTRYAKGEITKEQFEQMKKDLEE